MTTESDASALSDADSAYDEPFKFASTAPDHVRQLLNITEAIDLLLSSDDPPADAPPPVSKSPSRAQSSSLSRPWACDVLDIVLGEKITTCTSTDESEGEYEYECPGSILKDLPAGVSAWFYDTFGGCEVSTPAHGGSQHELVDQYYLEPQLWFQEDNSNDDEEVAKSKGSGKVGQDLFKDYKMQLCGEERAMSDDGKGM